MAFSASRGRRMTVGKIILRAYNLSGTRAPRSAPLTTEEVDLGKDLLEEIVDEIDAHGVSAKTQDFEEVTLTSGTYIYSMPEHVLDVFGIGMYRGAGVDDPASAETYVYPLPTEDWHTISAKSAQSRPTYYTPYRRADDLEIRLWPIPSDAGTIRFMTHVHLTDANDTTATLELEPYWTKYLFYALASQLADAFSLPANHVMKLESKSQQAFKAARTFSRQHPPEQMQLSHPTAMQNRLRF